MDAAYARGLELLVEEDLDGSLASFNEAAALDTEGRKVELYVKRSTVHATLGNAESAHADAVKAVGIDASNGMAQFRYGLALFSKSSYEAALTAFQAANESGALKAPKIAAELARCTRKAEAELADIAAAAEVEATAVAAAEAQRLAAAEAAKTFPMDWYQSMSHVTLEIAAPGLVEGDVKHSVSATNLTVDVTVTGEDARVVSYDWDLFAAVDPSACTCKVRSKKVELRLKKVNAELQWPALAAKQPGATAMDAPSGAGANASKVASAYASNKDWDKIATGMEEEKPEGEEALNHLFKDIYKNANEDTRRAMVKSFQTSGGTVLSTNWGEVNDKDYEKDRPAPSGMVWKNWEGDKLEVGEDDAVEEADNANRK